MTSDLPIHSVLPELLAALRQSGAAVLIASPGAGKTTAVAPALLQEAWCSGSVILLSPRRVAARAAGEAQVKPRGGCRCIRGGIVQHASEGYEVWQAIKVHHIWHHDHG